MRWMAITTALTGVTQTLPLMKILLQLDKCAKIIGQIQKTRGSDQSEGIAESQWSGEPAVGGAFGNAIPCLLIVALTPILLNFDTFCAFRMKGVIN